ncbi:hypothetical protein [Wenxinia marina]|uniref:Uncharacterized protein n=1 Tax=Wenxinia marina DSM 24838 TaxID=1123501 RepID=A0A0D0QG70_9RHOB|nr:hypothetical protein [Wenxinia marina]KIQ71242.1 hypothetical protein Wenmar_00008 [Wenxinia marina DSM 24838]GGL73092.1 hypothetical protein GCM10011392_29660 [Wenxinia marina]
MRVLAALLLLAGPAAAQDFTLRWLDGCLAEADRLAAGGTPATDWDGTWSPGYCTRRAGEIVCAYDGDPAVCRDRLYAQVTGRTFAAVAALPAAPEGAGAYATARADALGWRPITDCGNPGPPLTEEACEARNMGLWVDAVAAAQRLAAELP